MPCVGLLRHHREPLLVPFELSIDIFVQWLALDIGIFFFLFFFIGTCLQTDATPSRRYFSTCVTKRVISLYILCVLFFPFFLSRFIYRRARKTCPLETLRFEFSVFRSFAVANFSGRWFSLFFFFFFFF